MLALALLHAGAAPQQSQSDRGQSAKRPAPSESRVALVIGNGAYKDSPLPNPVNDARDMASVLKGVGFEVIPGENLTQARMKRAIAEFGQKIRLGGVGLFYFAGHGAQVKGVNYLIPVGAEIEKELDIEVEAVELDRVLNEMREARNRLNIVILDACRNNPFARGFRSGRGGLASVNAPTGVLIAYATEPGNTASDGNRRNGLYTQELLAAIRTPGLKVEDVFKTVRKRVLEKSHGAQTPWEHSSLVGDFYFVSLPASASTQSQEPAVQTGSAESKPDHVVTEDSANDSGRWVVVADRRVTVIANEAWADSGIQVKRGQHISIKASGAQVNLGALGYAGPGGLSRSDVRKPLGDCPTGALIARLGSEMICIESERGFEAWSEGKLWLGLNEGNFADNRGSFVAKVVVQEFRR